MKNNLWYIIKYGFFVLMWLTIIWFLSDQSNLALPLSSFWDLIIRKMAHWFFYTVLGLLLVKLITGYVSWSVDNYHRYLLLVMIFFLGVSLAAFDEIHQSFVVGRVASIWDVLIDSCGLFFGICWGARLQTNRLRHSIRVFLTK
ncbi:MAG: hypothetical protein COX77_04420 [Candidatus Komeilibacteria bacterium CG_4_10_14_0_2_um_filter_37_10]|uniref:VanZ-like domain-containing protein n=1 Tax=Candidatus Komeilibacteria bacterium CG_4_10_14_0_2_um_filter_37_10 TaxID=1974470 RepID=A0A2M7VDK4_9BACT|nr:MAG: hypothetical protein COX77_04420 [Candidatus Komeilibacteria bacterium CG_4_10_14_0_2_um_filter_37_10]